MLFSTLPQFIALLILFLAGVTIGLGLHPGGKKWRKRFRDESAHYAQFRRDADKRLAEAKQRIATLERDQATADERAAIAPASPGDAEPASAPIVAPPVERVEPVADATPPAAIHDTPVAAHDMPPPAPDTPRSNWFSIGGRPDLGRISGIDAALKTRLFELGVTRFEDITGLSAEDEMALEQRLALPAGYITREQWREQAALLQDGKEAEQAERFPAR